MDISTDNSVNVPDSTIAPIDPTNFTQYEVITIYPNETQSEEENEAVIEIVEGEITETNETNDNNESETIVVIIGEKDTPSDNLNESSKEEENETISDNIEERNIEVNETNDINENDQENETIVVIVEEKEDISNNKSNENVKEEENETVIEVVEGGNTEVNEINKEITEEREDIEDNDRNENNNIDDAPTKSSNNVSALEFIVVKVASFLLWTRYTFPSFYAFSDLSPCLGFGMIVVLTTSTTFVICSLVRSCCSALKRKRNDWLKKNTYTFKRLKINRIEILNN